jgi:hypothetical protein
MKNVNIICQKDLGGRYYPRYIMCAKLCVHISKTPDLIPTKINKPGDPTKTNIFYIATFKSAHFSKVIINEKKKNPQRHKRYPHCRHAENHFRIVQSEFEFISKMIF